MPGGTGGMVCTGWSGKAGNATSMLVHQHHRLGTVKTWPACLLRTNNRGLHDYAIYTGGKKEAMRISCSLLSAPGASHPPITKVFLLHTHYATIHRLPSALPGPLACLSPSSTPAKPNKPPASHPQLSPLPIPRVTPVGPSRFSGQPAFSRFLHGYQDAIPRPWRIFS